jgi:hypothetical protein
MQIDDWNKRLIQPNNKKAPEKVTILNAATGEVIKKVRTKSTEKKSKKRKKQPSPNNQKSERSPQLSNIKLNNFMETILKERLTASEKNILQTRNKGDERSAEKKTHLNSTSKFSKNSISPQDFFKSNSVHMDMIHQTGFDLNKLQNFRSLNEQMDFENFSKERQRSKSAHKGKKKQKKQRKKQSVHVQPIEAVNGKPKPERLEKSSKSSE